MYCRRLFAKRHRPEQQQAQTACHGAEVVKPSTAMALVLLGPSPSPASSVSGPNHNFLHQDLSNRLNADVHSANKPQTLFLALSLNPTLEQNIPELAAEQPVHDPAAPFRSVDSQSPPRPGPRIRNPKGN